MKKTAFTLLLLLFTQVAIADFSTALESYQSGRLSTAAAEFKTLANRNDADAQYMLGYMYALGEGVPQDYIKAYKWLNLAASQGKDGARDAQEKVARRMSRSQISRAQKLARNWKPVPTRIPPSYADQASTPTHTATKDTIEKVQQRLSELGYTPGPADGSPGRLTREAIRQYQTDHNMRVTGQITRKLVKHLLPAYIPAQSTWAYPRIWSAPTAAPNRQTKTLVKDLEVLLGKIRSSRAADRWVVRELQKLVKKNRRNWPHRLMHEQFSRRSYRLGRNWEITSGRFQVQPGQGLQSDTTASFSSRRGEREDLAAAILSSIIERDSRHQRRRQVAQIVTHQKISNTFAMRARFGSIDRASHISFMLSQSGNMDEGYRLVLNTNGRRDKVSLIRVNRHGTSVIDSYKGRLGLDNGSSHNLEWTRNKHGRMAVAINGQELFTVSNSDIHKRFKQFSITNIGGNYTLRELMLYDGDR